MRLHCRPKPMATPITNESSLGERGCAISMGDTELHFSVIALPAPCEEIGNADLQARPWPWVANRFRSGDEPCAAPAGRRHSPFVWLKDRTGLRSGATPKRGHLCRSKCGRTESLCGRGMNARPGKHPLLPSEMAEPRNRPTTALRSRFPRMAKISRSLHSAKRLDSRLMCRNFLSMFRKIQLLPMARRPPLPSPLRLPDVFPSRHVATTSAFTRASSGGVPSSICVNSPHIGRAPMTAKPGGGHPR